MADTDLGREYLAAAGFIGFVAFDVLDIAAISPKPGVYVVLRETDSSPMLLESSVGGRFKGRNPTVPIEVLKHRWVSDATVLYIGKATSLRARLRQFRDFGRGRPVGHWGGRYVWQLAGSGGLLVAWRTCRTPGAEEGRLLRAFETRYAVLPFANIVRGALGDDEDGQPASGDGEREERSASPSISHGISSSPVTAPELARQLGVDPKRLRSWLRRQGWRSPAEHGHRWMLDDDQVRSARQHFEHR